LGKEECTEENRLRCFYEEDRSYSNILFHSWNRKYPQRKKLRILNQIQTPKGLNHSKQIEIPAKNLDPNKHRKKQQ
jgi:hypothetical protein